MFLEIVKNFLLLTKLNYLMKNYVMSNIWCKIKEIVEEFKQNLKI